MNKTAQFTPGPWTVQLHNDLDTGDIRGANNEEIALCYMPDANLIAAAPAMYEALRNLLEVYQDSTDDDGSPAVLSAIDALAQAEGRHA